MQVAIVVAMTSSHNSYLLLCWRCGKWLQVVGKEGLTGKAEEGSDLSQQSLALVGAQKTEASAQSEFCVMVQK